MKNMVGILAFSLSGGGSTTYEPVGKSCEGHATGGIMCIPLAAAELLQHGQSLGNWSKDTSLCNIL